MSSAVKEQSSAVKEQSSAVKHFGSNFEVVRLANKQNGPYTKKINDEALIKVLKNIILSYWPNVTKDYFPAPQPVSLERKDLEKFTEFEYLVCVKSDGMRFLMINYEDSVYMVDRSFKFFNIDVMFKEGTSFIVDGELVHTKNDEWKYIIHDCISYNERNLTQFNFLTRYSNVSKIINDQIERNEDLSKDCIKLSDKYFVPFKDLDKLIDMINADKFDHCTDGLIFTPKLKRIGALTQYDLFKWKPRDLHTFDFNIQITDKGTTANVFDKDRIVVYALATGQDQQDFLNGLRANCPDFVNGSIVECKFDTSTEMFMPIKLRTDKTFPNSLKTVNKTMCNIKENITIDELIHLGSQKTF